MHYHPYNQSRLKLGNGGHNTWLSPPFLVPSAVFCAQKYFTIKTKRETDKIEDREATLYRYIF